jgi:hypothetical protein
LSADLKLILIEGLNIRFKNNSSLIIKHLHILNKSLNFFRRCWCVEITQQTLKFLGFYWGNFDTNNPLCYELLVSRNARK